MRILMILIPENDAPGKGDPAVRLERAVGPYFAFRDADFEVVLASPNGGAPAMEMTNIGSASAATLQRFRQDSLALDEFSDTLGLDQVYPDDFDAAFCVGLPDSIWRPEHKSSAGALIARMLDAGKPVAVMPSGIDLTPKGAGEGLMIVGDHSKSPVPIAEALIGAVRGLQIKIKREQP
jgi:hypothetical protein